MIVYLLAALLPLVAFIGLCELGVWIWDKIDPPQNVYMRNKRRHERWERFARS